MRNKPKIVGPDVFGWYHIIWCDATVQCFRSEKECRQWIADVAPLMRAMT